MQGYYKVPFRRVYCETFASWLKQTFWCHVVIKVFPCVADLGSDALKGRYLEEPELFFDQYKGLIEKANGLKSSTSF